MISHQAVSVTRPVEVFGHRAKNVKKRTPIFVVLIDRLTTITARSDVIERTGKFDPQRLAMEPAYLELATILDLTPIAVVGRCNDDLIQRHRRARQRTSPSRPVQSQEIFSVSRSRRSGLVQQPVQIAAALRLRDLTLFVRVAAHSSPIYALSSRHLGGPDTESLALQRYPKVERHKSTGIQMPRTAKC